MVQWTHFMMENMMFELQKQQCFLDYNLACIKFNKKYVDYLINHDYFFAVKKEKQYEEGLTVIYIFSKNIDENIEKCDEITVRATAKANKRWGKDVDKDEDDIPF